MADNLLKGRVRPSKDEDEEIDFTDSDEAPSAEEDSDVNPAASDDESGSEEVEEAQSESTSPSDEGDALDRDGALANITFGALASAQSSLGMDIKKRKHSAAPARLSKSPERSPSPFYEAAERRAGKKANASKAATVSRSSKHAPAEMSSKKAVSRKRAVVHVPAQAARDPRFSSLSGHANEQQVRHNYSFLDGYRASELEGLKKRAKDSKLPADERERLKREARVMEDRERSRKRVEEQRKVLTEHRRADREKVAKGEKKPYFLKQSDIKRQVLRNKFEEIGERKAEKLMERKRKRRAQKERKNMPDTRRSAQVP